MIKKISFSLIILAVIFLLTEAFAFAFAKMNHNLFRPESGEAPNDWSEKAYQRFLTTEYDSLTGWQKPRNFLLKKLSCLGEEWTLTTDADGARPNREVRGPVIMTVGDSYTQGAEVNDDQAYPSVLEELLGKEVLNYGVGGSGPLQAVLVFEQKIEKYPEVKTVVLGIMYENIMRMANAYRPALTRRGRPFGFKPYVKVENGTARHMPNPNSSPIPYGPDLQAAITTAIESDYWAKAREAFPYAISVGRVLTTETSRLELLERINRFLGIPQFQRYYQSRDLLDALESVIKRFVTVASEKGVRPIIVFIPQSKHDLSSPADFIARMKSQPEGMEILDVGRAEIDWARYNKACHPTSYGYRMIAEYIARAF